MARTTKADLEQLVSVIIKNTGDAGYYLEWAYSKPRLYHSGPGPQGRGRVSEVSPRLAAHELAIWLDGFTEAVVRPEHERYSPGGERFGNPAAVITPHLPIDVIARSINHPVGDFFRESNQGQWIDGALGQAHARERMRNILGQILDRAEPSGEQVRSIKLLLGELDDPADDDEDFTDEVLDNATDMLGEFTEDGYVWDWDAGDLVLLHEEEADQLPE